MKTLQTKIDALPEAIWIAGEEQTTSIYRGTPTEIVKAMASEMGDISIHGAVQQLCSALAQNRRVGIHLPLDLPEEQLAGLFVYALLDTRLAKPMARA